MQLFAFGAVGKFIDVGGEDSRHVEPQAVRQSPHVIRYGFQPNTVLLANEVNDFGFIPHEFAGLPAHFTGYKGRPGRASVENAHVHIEHVLRRFRFEYCRRADGVESYSDFTGGCGHEPHNVTDLVGNITD